MLVTRAQLRAAVANIHQILLPDADPDGEWRSALRLLVETIEFGATTDAAPVLGASKALPALL